MLFHRLVGPQLSPGPASFESTISCSQTLLICALRQVQVVERARRAPLLVGHHQRERDVLVGVGGPPSPGDPRAVRAVIAQSIRPLRVEVLLRVLPQVVEQQADRPSCRPRSASRRRSPRTPSTRRRVHVDGVGRQPLHAPAAARAVGGDRVGLPLRRTPPITSRVEVAGRVDAARCSRFCGNGKLTPFAAGVGPRGRRRAARARGPPPAAAAAAVPAMPPLPRPPAARAPLPATLPAVPRFPRAASAGTRRAAPAPVCRRRPPLPAAARAGAAGAARAAARRPHRPPSRALPVATAWSGQTVQPASETKPRRPTTRESDMRSGFRVTH